MAYTTIKKPSDYFNTKLYTGNGTAGTDITGVGFQPDWVWIKSRSAAGDHALQDVVRGATKDLESNNEGAEQNRSLVQAFISDGFTLGTGQTNSNGDTFASWNWLASNTTGSSNTDGSITSTVSANTTSGFSIVSYTGTGTQPSTVGHGLGVTPKMFIVKPRTDAQSWCVYHESVGAGYVTYLDITSGSGGSSVWNSTSPTSSVFTVNDNQVNSSGITYIAYCFADVTGYSKFGSYVGNGNSDGPFIYTGFKPAFVIAKLTSVAGENWYMWDNKRSTGNVMDKFLYPNLSDAEVGSTSFIDFLSNGFKLRSASDVLNGSGNTHIYMAFAEEPLVGDNPATAR